jgi:hypothetical protein
MSMRPAKSSRIDANGNDLIRIGDVRSERKCPSPKLLHGILRVIRRVQVDRDDVRASTSEFT